jgi:hypothetical protein
MKLNELALAEVALKAMADDINARLKDVRAAMQCELDDSGVRTVDATLPDGTKAGTVSRSTPKPRATVTDPDAFFNWVRDHTNGTETNSRVVREVSPAYEAGLLAEMTKTGAPELTDTETGEIVTVPGVTVAASRAASHSVRISDEQRAAIAAAWRSGQLAALDLPQLTTGEA